ncbi:hypothetical protein Y032_0024g974 [Ancylostoma ceylanicum]|uniref:Uncharacterized protein n=2 Tax=Ancylostoma ceylanicum TaxID=53326 RepID=A0A016UWS2_9BILA|nr:hypothetical protein Y032_0024g974 [Ancylostoma ceylanicum]
MREKEENPIFDAEFSQEKSNSISSVLRDFDQLNKNWTTPMTFQVIAFPETSSFGVLITISCIFVFLGFIFYFSYFIKSTCKRSRCRSGETELRDAKLPEQEHLVNKNLVDNALVAPDV